MNSRKCSKYLLFIFIFFFFTASLFSQNKFISTYKNLDGPCNSVETNSSYIFAGHGSVLSILNKNSPNAFKLISNITFNSSIVKIKAINNYCYVLLKKTGLFILDISDINNPFVIGKYEVISKSKRDFRTIDIDFPLASISTGSDGSVILSLKDPKNPIVLYKDNRNSLNSFIKNNRLYINSMTGFSIIDISDISNPKDILSTDWIGTVNFMLVKGTLIIAGFDYVGLKIFDISNINSPNIRGSFNKNGFFNEMIVTDDGKLFVSGNNSVGLTVFDISNPDIIKETASFPNEGSPKSLKIDNDKLFYVAGSSSLITRNLTNLSNTSYLNVGGASQQYWNIFIKSNRLFLSYAFGEIDVYDVSNFQTPSKIKTIQLNNAYLMLGVHVSNNNIIFIKNGANGYSLSITNIENLNNIYEVGSMPLPSGINSLLVDNNYVFLSSWSSGVIIVDISSPTNPKIINTLLPSADHNSLLSWRFNKYLFVLDVNMNEAYEGYPIYVYDFSNPWDIKKIENVKFKSIGMLNFINNYLFVSTRFNGVEVYDISNILLPKKVNSLFQGIDKFGMSVTNNYGLISAGENGNYVLDFTDMVNPSIIGSSPYTMDLTYNFLVDRDRFILSYYDGGFEIFTNSSISSVNINSSLPLEYSLSQNYPNPFNPSTTLNFSIPKSSLVKLTIYDILGREVATLANKEFQPGNHQITFDASKYSSGIYFYRMRANDFSEIKKMVLIK